MAPRGEISDSEDDDNLSPVKAPAAAPPCVETPEGSSIKSQQSTDPSFFRRIYEEQQAIATSLNTRSGKEQPVNIKAAALSQSPENVTRTGWHALMDSGSAPDVSHGRSPRLSTGAEAMVELEVDKLGNGHVLHDAATSPATQLKSSASSKRARVTNIYEKRTRNQRTMAHGLEAGESEEPETNVRADAPESDREDASPKSALKKKKKKSTSRQFTNVITAAAGTLEPAFFPECGELPFQASDQGEASSNLQHAFVSTSSTSLYIAQSTLTASQRQEFQHFSLSDEAEREVQNLPTEKTMEPGQPNQKSSGLTTIAYSTPGEFVSSGPKPIVEVDDEDGPSRKRQRRSKKDNEEPQSSPDVIAQPSSGMSRKKARKSAKGADASPDAYSTAPEGKSASKTVIAGLALGLESTPSDHPRRAEATQRSHQTSIGPLPPKKRGRKKKQLDLSDEFVVDDEVQQNQGDMTKVDLPQIDADEVVGSTKRKRGRPRKSELTKDIQVETTPQTKAQHEEQQTDDLEPLIRGVPEDESEGVANTDKMDRSHSTGLREIDRNRGTGPFSATSEQRDIKASGLEEKENLEASKPAGQATSKLELVKGQGTQPGKTHYRVGLSKKSRIAPLLKIVRK